MSEPLSGRALDRAIAEAAGWKVVKNVFHVSKRTGYTILDSTNGLANGLLSGANDWTEEDAWYQVACFHESLDATESLCAERGWSLRLVTEHLHGDPAIRRAIVWNNDAIASNADDGVSTATKAARALLAILTLNG